MKTITYDQLKHLEACEAQLDLFRERFNEVLKLTAETDPTIASGFNVDWLAENVLNKANFKEFDKISDTAWAEYIKVEAAAQADFDKISDAAWEEYNKTRDAALAEYDKAVAAARAEYDKARDAAQAEYDKAVATVFLPLYLDQE